MVQSSHIYHPNIIFEVFLDFVVACGKEVLALIYPKNFVLSTWHKLTASDSCKQTL